MKNLISVVIPCFNDGHFIAQAVDSVLNQTYEEIEIIVVDDGSDEATKSVLKRLESKITKLITQDNQGQSAARNRGIESAKGEFIFVLDSDDYLEPTYCERAIIEFKDQSVKIVTCQANIIIDEKITSIFTPAGGEIEDFLFSNASLGTAMFRKSDWKDCGRYDEKMRKGFEDWEFFIRVLTEGGKAKVLQSPLYNYRKSNNSTTSKANLVKYELLEYIYLKHKDIYFRNYEKLTRHLLEVAKREQFEKEKKVKSLEYVIGFSILKPIRFIKSLFS